MAACSTGLYRKRQILAGKETNCGEPAYLDVTATNLAEVQVSPTANIEVNMVENNVAKASLTMTPNIAGLVNGNLVFNSFIKGSGTPSIKPALDPYLEGCGFIAVVMTQLTLGSIVGDYQVGEEVTGGTSSATGTVRLLPNVKCGQPYLYIEVISGTFVDSEVVTGGTSGATGNIQVGGVSTEGFEYRLISENFQNLTTRVEEDGKLYKEFDGALGNLVLTGENSNPVGAEFTFSGRSGIYYRVTTGTVTAGPMTVGETITWGGTDMGIVVKEYDTADPYLIYTLCEGSTAIANTDVITGGTSGATATATADSLKTVDTAPLSSGAVYDPTVPPVLRCAELLVDGFQPIVQSFTLDLQNEVVLREDFNDCTGHQPATITGRNPSFTFNPEIVTRSEWAIYDDLKSGALKTGFDFYVGNVAGNTLVIQMDKLQAQTVTDGDRDGTAILDTTFMVTSETDDGELSLYFI